MVPLDSICEFQNGYAFRNQDYQESSEGAYKVFRMGNIRKGGGLKEDGLQSYIPKEFCKNLSRFVLKRDDLLICMTDMKASMALLGHTALMDKNDEYILNQRVGRITIRNPHVVDTRYLYYYSNSPNFIQHLRGVAHSGVQVNLSTEEIRAAPILLPPIEAQRQISSILSYYDFLIGNNTRRVKILEQMTQALYREWFVDFRFPAHGKFKMVESVMGPIPEGWSISSLGEVVAVNELSISPKDAPAKIFYIDIASVSTGSIDTVAELPFNDAPGRARRVVREGDTIWSTVRPNRRSYALILRPVPHLIASTGFAVLTPLSIPYSYLYFATTTDEFANYLTNHASGSAYPAVNSNDFAKAKILMPPQALLSKFQAHTEPMLQLIHMLKLRNLNLTKTRDLLLPKLISGEVNVEQIESEVIAQNA